MQSLFGNRCLVVFGALAALFVVCWPSEVRAEALNVDLADDYVEITSGFTGTDLVVFGNTLKRGDVVVVIEGPERDSVVRRKERTLGAWVNRASLRFEDMPSYYDYALSVEGGVDILSADVQKEKRVGLNALMVEPEKDRYNAKTTKLFQEGFIRSQQKKQVYPLKPQTLSFLGDGLFRADFHLPANVPSGAYKVRALLVNDGEVVYEKVKEFQVGLTGASSNIYKFSKNYSFLYGLLCVFIACVAGWLSNMVVQRN